MIPTRRSISTVLLTPALALGLVACGGAGSGSDTNNGTGSPDNWSVAATASDTNPTIQQAGGDTITVTVTRAGGFTGAVTLTPIVAAQGGITATIDNIATANNVTTGRLIILIGPSFPAGPQSVNVGVQPDGVAPITVAITVNIIVKPGVFVVVAPTLSVGQGGNVTAPVTIRRTNYATAVPMTLATTQAGLTATYSPNPVLDSTTTVTILVDASVPTGTYSVGIRANEGITGFQATAPLTLTVTQPGSFTMSLSTNTLFVPKGSSVPIGVTYTRTNFTGPITLTVTGAPADITATVPLNPGSGVTQTSVSFAASASALTGSYPVTITAAGLGAAPVSAVLTVSTGP
jgi:hypothetical protein